MTRHGQHENVETAQMQQENAGFQFYIQTAISVHCSYLNILSIALTDPQTHLSLLPSLLSICPPPAPCFHLHLSSTLPVGRWLCKFSYS